MKAEEFLASRVLFIKGLKSPTDEQKLLVQLAELAELTADDERKLKALVAHEKAEIKAAAARAAVARAMMTPEEVRRAERKARDHAMMKAAGLIGLAGLMNKRTGELLIDKGEFVGALLAIAETPKDEPRRASWKRKGDEVLAKC